jgi:hypothetical protein
LTLVCDKYVCNNIINLNYKLVSSNWQNCNLKHPSEMDMTDGCGLINLHAIHMLHERLNLWKEVPVAIQCRLAGAKVSILILLSYKEFFKHLSF